MKLYRHFIDSGFRFKDGREVPALLVCAIDSTSEQLVRDELEETPNINNCGIAKSHILYKLGLKKTES